MATGLTLLDLVAPALAADGVSSGSTVLDEVGQLPVKSWTCAHGPTGSVIRGVLGLDDFQLRYTPPLSLSVQARVGGTAATRPRDNWFDIRDTAVEFLLHLPRAPSALLDLPTGNPASDAATLLDALDLDLTDAPPSDAPGTAFTLDLLLTAVVLRPPGLVPARLDNDGALVPDPKFTEVRITAPKLKLRLAMPDAPPAGATGTPLDLALLSLGAAGLDDPGDLQVAELVTMEPPLALWGSSGKVGFGFRSATLDLSTGSTPPAILEKFGCDDDWRGLFLPEARLYVAPGGRTGLAFTGYVTDLLLSFEGELVLSADATLKLVEQGDGAIKLGARFIAAARPAPYAITYLNSDQTQASVALPGEASMMVDVFGGRAPYTTSVAIDGGQPVDQRTLPVSPPSAGGQRTVSIVVTDANLPPLKKTLDIAVTRLSATATTVLLPGQPTPGGPVPDATLLPTALAPGQAFRIQGQNATDVEVALDPPDPATSWQGGGKTGTGTTFTVPVGQGESVDVTATRAGGPEKFTAYWHFDRPPAQPPSLADSYGRDPANARTGVALDTLPAGAWSTDELFVTRAVPRLKALPPQTVTATGYASYDGDDQKAPYNHDLSRRRALGIKAQIEARVPTIQVAPDPQGYTLSKDEHDKAAEQHLPPPARNKWWRVDVVAPVGAPSQSTAKLHRDAADPPGTTPPVPQEVLPPDPPTAAPPPPPDWFREAHVTVRILRDQLIALELGGRIDLQTAAESQMPAPPAGQSSALPVRAPAGPPPPPNTRDGMTDLRVIWQKDPGSGTVTTRMSVGADPGDRDGLMLLGWRPGETPVDAGFGTAYLGFLATFLPLVSAAVPDVPGNGLLTDILDTAAVTALPAGLAAASVGKLLSLRIERVVLYGIEGIVEDRADGARVMVLFDIETAISGAIPTEDAWLVRISRDNPLSIRYKAVGVRIGAEPGETPGTAVPRFHPVFDASRGYTVDASRPGQIELRKGLDRILRILGARIARTNPLVFEVDIGCAVELGPVTISRVRVRLPMEPPYTPELTALGVAVEVPGAIRGKGEVEITQGGLGGSLDLTLLPIGLRISASLAVERVPEDAPASAQVTSVFVGLGLEFPAPIPLWTSGLGIYGFVGAFAMNRRRDQAGKGPQPTLEWLKKVDGDPSKSSGWVAEPGRWGFGLGAVLGTLEGGNLLNLRGALILELPGPNLLLTMKARLLAPRPGTLPAKVEPPAVEALAIIDIDLEAGTLSVGLVVEYGIKYLLKLKVPIEAFFDTHHPSQWHVWAGQYEPKSQRIAAKVLSAFDGSGYLMLQGDTLTVANLPATKGFGVAAGIDVHFLWGSTDAGLYARVGGGFDALLGFDPVRLDAILRLDGELRLFIVSIGAHAELKLTVAKDGPDVAATLKGEVCGHVDFFFFDVEGCVDFAMGLGSLPDWTAPDLVSDFAVMSRSPALVAGSGIGRPIDAKVKLNAVPIDSIPVLTLRAPVGGPLPQVFNKPIGGPSGGSVDGFAVVGGRRVRYLLTSVELLVAGDETAPAFYGTPQPSADETPSVWWLRDPPSGTAPSASVQLALLTWTPTPAAKAIEYGVRLTEQVTHRWGKACGTAAPAAPTLWTFLRHPIGPSPKGWRLWDGIAWPDPPGTIRSEPPDIVLRVGEAWRASTPPPAGVEPAAVEIRAMACPKIAAKRRNPFLPRYGEDDRLLQLRLEAESKAVLAAANGFGAAAGGVKAGGAEAKTMAAATAITRVPTRTRLNCYGRMLGSPAFDEGQGGGFGGYGSPEAALNKLFGLGDEPPPPKPASALWNALWVEVGPCRYARLFLLVRDTVMRAGRLVVQALDDKGKVVAAAALKWVKGDTDLPPSWSDFGGPWQRSMAFVRGFNTVPGYIPMVAAFDTLEGAVRIEIGVAPAEMDGIGRDFGRDFYLGAVEALRLGEEARAAWDADEIARDAAVVASALAAGAGQHALLIPGTKYVVRAKWQAQEEGKAAGDEVVQDKEFTTDTVPPGSLRPWLVTSHPAEGEAHVFGGEKVSVVLATDDVARLWQAYGYGLRMKLRAASFRQPDAKGAPYPWPVEGKLEDKPGSIVSPWEQAVTEAINGGLLGCVGKTGTGKRNAELTIPVPLDTFTDYTLVIEQFKDKDQDEPAKVVLSVGFSTSGWRTAADFARAFSGAPVAHAHLPAPDPLAAFVGAHDGRAAPGAAFDRMCGEAGLGALPPPAGASVTILWADEPGQPPRPVAILVDAVEAIWRTRAVPRPFLDAESQTTRSVPTPLPWLRPVELQPDPDPAAAPVPLAAGSGLVGAVTWVGGGQRGLFLLKPGARGKPVSLGLRHVKLALGPADGGTDPCPDDPAKAPSADGPPAEWLRMFGITLAAAPWEDDEA